MDNRSVWIDNVRVVATIAVVVVHVATPAVFTRYSPGAGASAVWWTANIYDSFARFCVPVFVMLTGTLLLPQPVSLSHFIKKRLNRILIPFMFWSLVYIVYDFLLKLRDEGRAAFSHLGGFIYVHVVQGAAPHLWYIYMIIGIYLFIPIIQPWIANASNKAILFFLSIWLFTLSVDQLKLNLTVSPLDLRYFSGYAGYLVLGYYISERLVITTSVRNLAVGLFCIGGVATLFGTFFSTCAKGSFSHGFYEYLTLNVLIMAASAYVIIKGFSSGAPRYRIVSSGRRLISRYGYGIYLGHLLIVSLLAHYHVNYQLLTPWLGIPVVAAICISITCLLIYVLNKLPYGKYISG